MIRNLVCLVSMFACIAFAQEYRATLSGNVNDPSGAAIPNAAVRATNTATHHLSETQTGASGLFTIPLLEPGVYTVEAVASGFQTIRKEGVVLAVSEKVNLPIILPLGQSSTAVTVHADQEVLDTTSSDRGLVFDPTRTQELPLNGRQSYMLLTLTPGVIFTQEQFGASGFSGTRGWDANSSYKFNGARAGNGNNAFLLNGSIISNENSTWLLAPSVEAISEFKAITTVFDAQYGHEAGGIVNTIVKTGTNNWHGDVYDYFRNRVLDANSFQNNYNGLDKGRHNQNQFGGVVGGPLRKDKDFVFVSYEGWQEVVPFPASGTTVPADLRNGTGFSNHGMVVYDPLTTHLCGGPGEPCSSSQYWRSPFPGNVIPANRISPIATKILSYLPPENGPGQGAGGISGNFVANHNEGRYWYNQPLVRYDHDFSEKDRFNFMYSHFHGYEFRSSTGFAKPIATGNTDNERTFTGINIFETHVISPTMVLDLRGNLARFIQDSPGYNNQALKITPESIGMTGMIHAPTVTQSVIPNINIGGFSGALFGNGSFNWAPYTSWQFTPNLSWVRNRHALHFGFEYRYESRGSYNPGNAWGTLTFGPALTRQATDRSTSTTDQFNGIATLLLGIPTGGSIDNNASTYETRPYYAGYAQDDWRVNERLTINMGLRYEVQLPYLERYNRANSAFDVSAVSPINDQLQSAWRATEAQYNATNPKYPYPDPPAVFKGAFRFAGTNGLPRRQFYTDWTDLAPRIGFAYRVAPKTLLRGGFGTYYQSIIQTGASTTGFSQTTSYQANTTDPAIPSACTSASCANAPTGPYSLVNPFPNGLTPAPGSALGLLSNYGQGPNTTALVYKVPRTYQYNFGIQHQFPGSIVADVAFSGNFVGMTPTSHDIGFPQDAAGLALLRQAIADPAAFNTNLPNPFLGILPATTGRGSASTLSREALLNSYALWGGVSDNNISRQTFRSDAMQMRIEKKDFGGGSGEAGVFTSVFSWTFSKEYAFLCCAGPSYINGDDNFRYQLDSNNKTQELAFSGVWDLPFGKGRHFGANVTGVTGKVVSGWRADYILTYISGFPIGLPNIINKCGNWSDYIDPATGRKTGQNEFHWFNNDPACYAQFPTYADRLSYNPPRFSGNVNAPAVPILNFAIAKTTQISERYSVQFRAESFNLTNTPIRNPPNTTFPSATFGQLPEAQYNFPRLVQLALKLYF
ncbi:MAG: carboxypeptidase regulatory-like domain-containing protein [Bryobacteraceae bacterium]